MSLVLLDIATAVDPLVAYGFEARLLFSALLVTVFLIFDVISDRLDISIWQWIFRTRHINPTKYLSLKSRIVLSPFIVGFIFLVPNSKEPPSDLLGVRLIVAIAVAIVGIILSLFLGWRDAERF
jgi:hypothetical protein